MSTAGPSESIALGSSRPLDQFLPSVALRVLVSKACHARGVSTGTATLLPGAELPYHVNGVSEAITVLSGEAHVSVAGRRYTLSRYDCIHVPRDLPHKIANPGQAELVAHWALASSDPARTLVEHTIPADDRGRSNPLPGDPESITRFADAEVYELSPGAFFRDLFAKRFGSEGICGGYGVFQPGASLPCHIHKFDESITIVEGRAICMVEGRRYQLGNNDTAFVPEGHPHRFLNQSTKAMAMIWVYAGSEPERTLVDAGYCSGSLVWPGPAAISA